MRKELLNFLGLTLRSYYEWKNHKHPNIIQIINDVFREKDDILFFNLFGQTPQMSYFHKDAKDSKNYRKKFCEILEISPSSYYHWQTGKRKNIIKLFRLIFKNPENIEYWLKNKKFEIENQKIDNTLYNFINDLSQNQKFIDKTNNLLDIGNISPGFKLGNFDLKHPIIYFLLNLDFNKINNNNNIKYSIVNQLKIDDYISIDSYIQFLKILDKYHDKDLKKIFNKEVLNINFLDSIKRLDIDFFVKLIFFTATEKNTKWLLHLVDELISKLIWENKIKIDGDKNKNISLINIKMGILMETYSRFLKE